MDAAIEGNFVSLCIKEADKSVERMVKLGQPGCGSILPICSLISEMVSASIIIKGKIVTASQVGHAQEGVLQLETALHLMAYLWQQYNSRYAHDP